MQEQTINDVRVVFRDTIPARYGWDLMTPMTRLSERIGERIKELKAENPEDEVKFVPWSEVCEMIRDIFTWEQMVKLVRGAVVEWGFAGDLSTDACCDDLDLLSELFPIVGTARLVYLGVPLTGE